MNLSVCCGVSARDAGMSFPFQPFCRILTLRRRHDAGDHDKQIQRLGTQQVANAAGFTHQAQVGVDETDRAMIGVAEGSANDENVRAEFGQVQGDGAANAGRTADDRDLLWGVEGFRHGEALIQLTGSALANRQGQSG
jgi:hypothetical protein